MNLNTPKIIRLIITLASAAGVIIFLIKYLPYG
jgi:hypothetical protein